MRTAAQIFDDRKINIDELLMGQGRKIIEGAIQAGIDEGMKETGVEQFPILGPKGILGEEISFRSYGIMPQFIWVVHRLQYLNEAIKRLNYKNCEELINERNGHEHWLAARRSPGQTGNTDQSKDSGAVGQRQEAYPG